MVGKKRHPLYDAMLSHGIDKFKMEIIDSTSIEYIHELEIKWISDLDTINTGYNLTSGGTGGDTFTNRSEESKEITRKKHRDIIKKRLNSDPYVRQNLSERGKKNWKNPEYREKVITNQRRVMETEEYRIKHSQVMKETLSDPIRRKTWSDAKLGSKNNKWLGYLICIDTDGNEFVYETSKAAANAMGCVAFNLSTLAKTGSTFQRGKYKGWKFILSKDEIYRSKLIDNSIPSEY